MFLHNPPLDINFYTKLIQNFVLNYFLVSITKHKRYDANLFNDAKAFHKFSSFSVKLLVLLVLLLTTFK